jgi:protein-tyrosine phosphatase
VILVQLTGWEENGVAKADRYIPYAPPLIREMMTDLDSDDGSGQSTSFTDISGSNKMYLQLTKQRRVPELSSVVTEMCLHSEDGAHVLSPHEASGAGEEGSMTVFHYHYDAWPDHGVPEGQAVVALRRLIMEIARRREDLGGCELWVHW